MMQDFERKSFEEKRGISEVIRRVFDEKLCRQKIAPDRALPNFGVRVKAVLRSHLPQPNPPQPPLHRHRTNRPPKLLRKFLVRQSAEQCNFLRRPHPIFRLGIADAEIPPLP